MVPSLAIRDGSLAPNPVAGIWMLLGKDALGVAQGEPPMRLPVFIHGRPYHARFYCAIQNKDESSVLPSSAGSQHRLRPHEGMLQRLWRRALNTTRPSAMRRVFLLSCYTMLRMFNNVFCVFAPPRPRQSGRCCWLEAALATCTTNNG